MSDEEDVTCESVTDSDWWTDGGESDRRERRELLNSLLEILASHRRRDVLYYLRNREVAGIDELTRYLVEESSETPNETDVDERLERMKATVVHTDLPKLRDTGVIEYDSRTGTIRYRQPPKELQILLRVCSGLEEPSTGSE